MRITLEINLLYTNMRQVMTTLTTSQTAIHNHFAKTISNPITIRMMLKTAAVMTTVKMTMTTPYTARTQATNDNQRH